MIKIPEGATHVEFKDGNYVFEFPEGWVAPYFNWRLAACPQDHTLQGVTQEEQDYLRELDDEFLMQYELPTLLQRAENDQRPDIEN